MKNTYIGKQWLSTIFTLLFVSSVNANLIENGDFETVTSGGFVKSWGVSNLYDEGSVENWRAGNNDYIELWTEGSNSFAELNADWSSSEQTDWVLKQTVQLDLNMGYKLSFQYRARQDDNEAFRFKVTNSQELSSWNTINDHDLINQWYTYEGFFTASATKTKHVLNFRSENDGDTYGNFIDNVSLTKVIQTAVPSPGSLLLFALGMIGLGFYRKRDSTLLT
ncbi:DUF642 domain-containing protein [Psychromonas sp. psych-6C06]|uniref:DUF642 domain-containing protein n=1 Tax=Psychromonas sp. psych-6C06 TaxID=2058089 RepID=UPI00187C8D60|nr:DUF642 domain-containing protein [Psychromonas sp. psych-6C06]